MGDGLPCCSELYHCVRVLDGSPLSRAGQEHCEHDMGRPICGAMYLHPFCVFVIEGW